MRDAALEYAARGVPVFPVWGVTDDGRCRCGITECKNTGKHPLGRLAPNGFKDATTDKTQICEWWEQEPDANIGTPTETRLVLDVDPRHGGDETLAALERQHGALPPTPHLFSGGGGDHYHFAMPMPPLSNTAGKLGPGLDTRGVGGYVLLPPSRHASGRLYRDDADRPLLETPLAPAPPWMLLMLAQQTPSPNGRPATTAPDWPAVLTGAPEGQRHAIAVRIAGHYLAKKLPPAEVTQIVLGFASRCTPPFPADEATRIVQDLAGRDAVHATAAGTDDPTMPWSWAKVLQGKAITDAIVREPEWLVEGLFSRCRQHAIIGASGSAKTWLEFDLAVSVALPSVKEFLGLPLTMHGPVVIESWEQGQDEDKRRLQKLLRGHGVEQAPDTLILASTPFLTLNDDSAFQARLRDLRAAGALLYAFDSLSEGAGIELNDNTLYTGWWRARIRPLLEAGITVVFTHLRGHLRPGTSADRDAAFRGATQIRALSTAVIECRQLSETTSLLIHNKYRDTAALGLGVLTLAGAHQDPVISLGLTAKPHALSKSALARKRLLDLASAHPGGITRKIIEAALNDPRKATIEAL